MNSIYKAKGEKIHFGEKALETDFHMFLDAPHHVTSRCSVLLFSQACLTL